MHFYPRVIPTSPTTVLPVPSLPMISRNPAVLLLQTDYAPPPSDTGNFMEMDESCEFCCQQRSVVYCGSDAAFLCLSCDRNIHSANALSKRHSRTLVCDQCHREPAVVRCLEEEVSLCLNCNWSGHTVPPSSLDHKRQAIDCYSGCPSAAEFSKIWPFFSFGQSAFNPELGFTALKEGDESLSCCQMSPIDYSTEDAAMATLDSFVEQFHGNESLKPLNDMVQFPCIHALLAVAVGLLRDKCHEDLFNKVYTWTASVMCKCIAGQYPLKTKQFGTVHDTIYESFDITDLDFCLDNCEALYDEYIDDPRQFFESTGMDSLFENENSHDSECHVEYTNEIKESCLKRETLNKACCNPDSTNSVTHCISEQNISPPRPAESNLRSSFPDNRRCHDTRDHDEYGGLSTVIREEHPCTIPSPENWLSSARRDDAVLRYREKKKSRMFDKKVRYASRKARADVRKRVKGRFVKAGDPYDYDPLSVTING